MRANLAAATHPPGRGGDGCGLRFCDVSALPLSATLALWLDAVRAGHTGPDELADAVRGEDPRHLVVGARGENGEAGASGDVADVLELVALPVTLTGPLSLALPAPGDPVGLGGPASTNRAALEAGEAVLCGPVALVPEDDARTVVWRALPAGRAPYVDERETARDLRLALAEVTTRLVALDVASWGPEVPDLLMNLRHRAPLPLPPGVDDRRRETLERAVLCLEIVHLASGDDGGSVTALEADARRAALADLDRAARHALVGACTGRA